MKLLSRVQLLATPWIAAYQTPPSMGFSRQDYWSGSTVPSINRAEYVKMGEGIRIPAELFQILKMMLLKCCIQYASKFGKLISGQRSGKGQFSSQAQRSAVLKNVQTTAQLHSFPMLVRSCSKFFKLVFSSTRLKNFQMYKLGLEKA